MSVYNKCYDARFSSRGFSSATSNYYSKHFLFINYILIVLTMSSMTKYVIQNYITDTSWTS